MLNPNSATTIALVRNIESPEPLADALLDGQRGMMESEFYIAQDLCSYQVILTVFGGPGLHEFLSF